MEKFLIRRGAMKKIKNPEKYVKRLKSRIESLESFVTKQTGRLMDERGVPWFFFVDGITHGVEFHNKEVAQQCRISQPIIIKGQVVSIHDKEGKRSATLSLKEVRLEDI